MTDQHPMTRRCALGMLALGTSAPIITACGGDGGETGSSAPTTSGGSDSTAPTTETSSSSPSSETSPTASGREALVAVSDVPVGGGIILAGQEVVITQPSKGEFLGFSAICPHAQFVLSEVSQDDIFCGDGHGSRFTLDDGAVLNGPATSPLTSVEVAVEGGQVVRA